MAKLNIPPTKSNYLKIKQNLKIAKEGYEILEQKREILVLELMQNVEKVKRLEKELDTKLKKSYDSLKETILTIGYEKAFNISQGINYNYQINGKTHRLIGMDLPTIELDLPKLKIQYSFMGTQSVCDSTAKKFMDLLTTIVQLAETRTIVWKLAREVRKTQRRVNALDKIIIPDNEETQNFIESALEESERESFFVRKLLKSKSQS